MGHRAMVKIHTGYRVSEVHLYTHDLSYKLPLIIKSALKKRIRWSDGMYLARIVFEEMLKSADSEELGFGISTEDPGDLDLLIVLNTAARKISFYERSLKGKKIHCDSFEGFVMSPIPKIQGEWYFCEGEPSL